MLLPAVQLAQTGLTLSLLWRASTRLNLSIKVGGVNNEERQSGRLQYLLGDAAQHQAGETASAVSSHRQHVIATEDTHAPHILAMLGDADERFRDVLSHRDRPAHGQVQI